MDREFDAARYRRSSLRACPNKRQYATWAEARAVATRATRKDGWDHMDPYRCRACSKYHVGHPLGD